MKQTFTLFCSFIVLFFTSVCFAEISSKPKMFSVLLGLNGAYGGDTLISVIRSNDTKEDFHAGSGLGLYAGTVFRLENIDLRSTIGFLHSGGSYENGGVSFIRYPIDISSHYFFGKFSGADEVLEHGIGGGVAYHLSPTLSVDLKGSAKGDARFENGMGYFVEYLFGSQSKGGVLAGGHIGLRYTFMTYRFNYKTEHEDYNANNLSINLGISF